MNFVSSSSIVETDDDIAKEQIFDFIKEANKTSQLGPVSWNTALKFLRAKKFNLNGALELFDTYQKTRISESLVDVSPFEIDVCRELLSCKVTVLPTRGLEGAAVVLVSVRLFAAPVNHTAFLRSFIYNLDVLTDKKEVQQSGIILLVDMTDASYSNVDLSLAMKIYNIVNGAYPARLRNIFVVDAPLWFRAAFRTLSTVFRRKMTDRVVFAASTSELASRIGGKQALPSHLGGTARVDHHAWFEKCLLFHPDSSTVDVPKTLRQAASGNPSAISTSTSKLPRQGSRASHGSLNIKGLTISIVQNQPATKNQNNLDSENSDSDLEDLNQLKDRHSATSSSDSEQQQARRAIEAGLMTPNELVDYVMQVGESGLRKEYTKLRSAPLPGSCSVGRKSENVLLNRYSDVPCLDSTRVRLNIPGRETDYIHANFISLAYQPAALICTQGPLDNTIADFWAMVWQYQVRVVVMTTRLHERGRAKCAAYWPASSGAQLICQSFIVSTMSVDVSNPHWTVSTLSIVDTLTGDERTVFHLFFHGWPDFGIPEVGVFCDFLDAVDKFVALSSKISSNGVDNGGAPSSPDLLAGLVSGAEGEQSSDSRAAAAEDSSTSHHSPIVIHCSAGIGRAGTFAVVWHCRHQLAISETETPQIDLMSAVHSVRSMRALAVQTADQFGFCWLAVIEICRRRGLVTRNVAGVADIVAQLQG